MTDTSSAAAKKDVTKLQRIVIDALEDVKAAELVLFDTEHLSSLFERVVIASGSSNRQTRALASSVRDKVREAGYDKPRVEGEDNGEWIVIDCGGVVVHVMQPTIRSYYHLEDIWGDKPVRLKTVAAEKAAAKRDKVTDSKKKSAIAIDSIDFVATKNVAISVTKTSKPTKPAPLTPRVASKSSRKPAPKTAPVKAAGALKTAAGKSAAGKTAAAKTTATQTRADKTAGTGSPALKKVVIGRPPTAKTTSKKTAKPALKSASNAATKAATKPATKSAAKPVVKATPQKTVAKRAAK